MQPHARTRFEQFSDGVFAIAITLLALELRVPELTESSIGASLKELVPLLPNILTFVLSFVTIAIFWVNHHQLTRSMTHTNRRILWANILFLLFLTLIPFATSVVSVNPFHPLAVATYSAILFVGSVGFSVLRYFIHKSCDKGRVPMRRTLVGPAFYALAVIASFFIIKLAIFILLIPPLFYFLPKSSIRHDN
jgi:uncharacterized membrane protein